MHRQFPHVKKALTVKWYLIWPNKHWYSHKRTPEGISMRIWKFEILGIIARKWCDRSGKFHTVIMNACKMFYDTIKSVLQMLQMLKNAWESYKCVVNGKRIQTRVFFGPFWRPIFGRVPNAKKYVFFPIWIRKFPIQGTKKTGEKITKYRHFTMFMFVVERAGPNSPNDTREITKYCKLPNGNVPLRQFSRIYSRRCRGAHGLFYWYPTLAY